MLRYDGSASHRTVGHEAHHGSAAPNHVLERIPHTTVADENTVKSTNQLRGSFLRSATVAARNSAPYAPSPTSIAKNSEK